mgnify:CR=1 FL=1
MPATRCSFWGVLFLLFAGTVVSAQQETGHYPPGVEGLKGSKGYGIFELKDGTLKLAYGTEKKENRPKDFDGKDGFYFELKKKKDKPKE